MFPNTKWRNYYHKATSCQCNFRVNLPPYVLDYDENKALKDVICRFGGYYEVKRIRAYRKRDEKAMKILYTKKWLCGRCSKMEKVFLDEDDPRCCGCGYPHFAFHQKQETNFRAKYGKQQILTCPKGYHKHHITDKIVIPIPAKIHMKCGAGRDVEKHRENVLEYLAARNPVLYGIAIFLLEEIGQQTGQLKEN